MDIIITDIKPFKTMLELLKSTVTHAHISFSTNKIMLTYMNYQNNHVTLTFPETMFEINFLKNQISGSINVRNFTNATYLAKNKVNLQYENNKLIITTDDKYLQEITLHSE
jgi:hypothetical protein